MSGLSREEVINILRENTPQQAPTSENPQLASLLELLLRKEKKTLEKEEEDELRRLQAREDMIKVTMEAEAIKVRAQANCSHTKENGRSAVAQQQVHNDGYIHPFCMRCGKVFAKRRPTHEEMPTAVEV